MATTITIYNLTDVETPQLKSKGLLHQPIVVGRLSIAPGEGGTTIDDATTRRHLEHYVKIGADGVLVVEASNTTPTAFTIGQVRVARATDAFGPPRRVGELSSSRDEYPRWLSRDRCRLYFARDTANASNDVFVAKRSPR